MENIKKLCEHIRTLFPEAWINYKYESIADMHCIQIPEIVYKDDEFSPLVEMGDSFEVKQGTELVFCTEKSLIDFSHSVIASYITVKSFTQTPWLRYIGDGTHSGEEFFKRYLLPKFQALDKMGGTLFIDLDGTLGYTSAFLAGSFGLLAKRFGEKVLNHLYFKSDDSLLLVEEIRDVVKNPQKYEPIKI